MRGLHAYHRAHINFHFELYDFKFKVSSSDFTPRNNRAIRRLSRFNVHLQRRRDHCVRPLPIRDTDISAGRCLTLYDSLIKLPTCTARYRDMYRYI